MELTTTQGIAYVGAGAATGAGFTALRHGTSAKPLAFGIATGVIAGGVQSAVQASTGSSELGWLAAAGSGAAAGAVLLGGFASPGLSPIAARGIGAGIGVATGIFGPLLAGMVLAQVSRTPD